MEREYDVLELVKSKLGYRPKIVKMFEHCYQNTLETTIRRGDDGTVFMLTGDIPAMWLRDSTNQLRPYLLIAKYDIEIQKIIEGVMKKQFQCILIDSYANAFNEKANGAGHQTDITDMDLAVWERKYEVDSLCYSVQLAYLYWKNVDKTEHFDELFYQVIKKILKTWRIEQHHMKLSPYRFERRNCPDTDTLSNGGKGTPVKYTGMTWSGFRPSDDACQYGYLIPSNMFAVVVLGYMEEINKRFYQDSELNDEIRCLRYEMEQGIRTYGLISKENYGSIYAYEVDGLGNQNFMDDANVPSLLSMPYFHYCSKEDPDYLNTRKWILSHNNPYYYKGKVAAGIGSPHTPKDYIWHIALAIQGLTSTDRNEQEEILSYFEQTDADTNYVHEGFHKDDPFQYTREWFSWANAVFVEFILSMCGLEVKS